MSTYKSLLTIALLAASSITQAEPAELFKKKCSICHRVDSKAMGPPIKKMKNDSSHLQNIILNGKKMMPAFANKLNKEEVNGLTEYIQSFTNND